MYIFVNDSLKMGKGKIAAQVGHVITDIVENMIKYNSNIYYCWKKSGQKKIILKTTEQNIQNIIYKYNPYIIRDQGKTQILPNSLTVIGFEPMIEKNIPSEFKNYKLL
jgi:PTH2 family peptidyl-tRNA hydrolase